MIFNLSKNKQHFLEVEGHLLATGGPGSGKTTIALMKAQRHVIENRLRKGQRVLFLSFARATIARIAEQAIGIISKVHRERVEINTYHGFMWNLIRSYGFLLHSQNIQLLTPSNAASRLSSVAKASKAVKEQEKLRLLREEALLHFDLFASKAYELLSGCSKLRKIISSSYPFIILDEFQDTDAEQWSLIQLLGEDSVLLALADLDQRIYDFRGASPYRVKEFIDKFNPIRFDFDDENHRNGTTEIAVFGNDLLLGRHRGKQYNGVIVEQYPFSYNHIELKKRVISEKSRLQKNAEKWTLAILVPTNKLMLEVSDALEKRHDFKNGSCLPHIRHEVAIDSEAPTLAAILISGLLEGGECITEISNRLLINTREYLRGHRGDHPTQNDLRLADGIDKYITTGKSPGSKRSVLIKEANAIAASRAGIRFIGSPEADWITVRSIIERSASKVFIDIAKNSKYLRLLHKGTTLRSRLNELWKQKRDYTGSTETVKNALLQDHFVATTKALQGIYVMTMHKSKGKQFDEVIVYEGQELFRDRFNKANQNSLDSRLRLLRVAITRAKNKVTILTPMKSPSEVFF